MNKRIYLPSPQKITLFSFLLGFARSYSTRAPVQKTIKTWNSFSRDVIQINLSFYKILKGLVTKKFYFFVGYVTLT